MSYLSVQCHRAGGERGGRWEREGERDRRGDREREGREQVTVQKKMGTKKREKDLGYCAARKTWWHGSWCTGLRCRCGWSPSTLAGPWRSERERERERGKEEKWERKLHGRQFPTVSAWNVCQCVWLYNYMILWLYDFMLLYQHLFCVNNITVIRVWRLGQ